MKKENQPRRSERICECGHEKKYHSEGFYEKYKDKDSPSGKSCFCELPGCYYSEGESPGTCSCKKFTPQNNKPDETKEGLIPSPDLSGSPKGDDK